MARHSRSPSREDSRDKRRSARRSYSPSRRYRDSDRDAGSRSYDHDRRKDESVYRMSRRGNEDAERGSSSRDFDRRDRDRNRDRDRQRDSRDRERDRPSTSRRSASPPQRSRSRSDNLPQEARSKSKSVEPEDKAKPNFGHSGLLAAATKTVKHADGTGTVLKYHEPPEARKPIVGWRLYVFKGKEQTDLLHIHRQSAYLIGRDKLVADITIDHPSCSKQHAVIQYRQIHEKNEFGESKTSIKPFIIDLESTNGTQVNDEPVPTSRYFELKLGDVIKFGDSTREYVLLSEDAA